MDWMVDTNLPTLPHQPPQSGTSDLAIPPAGMAMGMPPSSPLPHLVATHPRPGSGDVCGWWAVGKQPDGSPGPGAAWEACSCGVALWLAKSCRGGEAGLPQAKGQHQPRGMLVHTSRQCLTDSVLKG